MARMPTLRVIATMNVRVPLVSAGRTFSVAVNGKRLDARFGPYQGTAFNR
jgi:hypothetical protein